MNEENTPNKDKDEELDPAIRAFRDEFKRKADEKNNKRKTYNDKNSSRLKRLLPYLGVIAGYVFVLYILVMIVDNIIVPNMVHDRPIVKVPELVGLDIKSAEERLNAIGLSYEISGEQYSTDLPPETVIRQTPFASTEVKEGRPVYLTLSKGKETVKVPSLVGLDIRKAKLEIMKHGLVIGELQYQHSETYPKDTIMAQSIPPGKKIEYGKALGLTISKGSEQTIEMPLLIGQRLEDIMEVLESNGLRLGNVRYETSETYQSNVIIDQSPKEFTPVQLGTYVNITVSG